MKIKKNCWGCKALKHDDQDIPNCTLGYKIEKEKRAPLEVCPKPRTMANLIKIKTESN